VTARRKPGPKLAPWKELEKKLTVGFRGGRPELFAGETYCRGEQDLIVGGGEYTGKK